MLRRFAQWFALACAGLVTTLLAIEIALRLWGLGSPVLYDNRLAWGYRPLPNQTHQRIAQARVRVNAFGVRGADVDPRRPPGVERLLFLGDSVTWGGSYVDDRQLFGMVAAGMLEARLGLRVEALVAGVNAWGPANILGLVRATGGFDASTWVVTALEDDFRREKTRIGETPYFNRAPRLAIEEALVYGAYTWLGRYRVPRPAPDLARVGRRNLARFAALADIARRRGVRMLYVWHPTEGALRWNEAEPHREPYLALATRLGDGALDLTSAYRAARSPVYVDGMHLSIAGHRAAGEAIADVLARMLLADR